MSNLSIRKKSINTWLHTDSVFGDFIISKFYFNSFFAKFQIVEEGNARLEQYEIANITLYDDTDGGVAETFTNITELSLRLEELQYPAFDRVGTSVFPSMEQITNVNVTDIEDGQVLAWDVATSKWLNITIGGLTTPNLQEVTDESPSLTKTIEFAGDPSRTFASSLTEIIIGAGENYNVDEEAIVKAYGSFSNGVDTLLASVQVQNEVTAGYLRMELDTTTNKAIAILSATNESQGFRASADHSNFLEDLSYVQKIYADAIIVNANITAINDRKYTVIANATFTDPTPVEGKGYTVFVRNGTATIGGVGYTAGSLVYRVYYSGAWGSYNQSGFIPITGTPTDVYVTGALEYEPEAVEMFKWKDEAENYNDFFPFEQGFSFRNNNIEVFFFRNDGGLEGSIDASDISPANKLYYAQRSYVDNELKPIVVSTSVTATLNRVHNVVATATLTDPTPTEGMGYPVNVINGTATIGGVGYTAGSLVYRFYQGGVWSSTSIGGTVPDADASTKGIAKLYTDLLASNTDGSVTQSALVTEFNLKDVLPVIYEKHANVPIFGSASLNNLEGVTFAVTGGTARTFSDTSIYTRRQRLGLVTTTTGNPAQMRQTIAYFNRNSNLLFIIGLGFAENCTNPNVRAFAGVCANLGVFGNTEPTALLNCIGLAKLTTSNNLHVIHNDGSGTATAIDLGATFPTNTVETDFYILIGETNGSNINYTVNRVNTGGVATGTITTDLPSPSTALNLGYYVVQNTGANTNTGIDFFGTNLIKQ